MLNLLIANQNCAKPTEFIKLYFLHTFRCTSFLSSSKWSRYFNSMISNHYDMALLDYNLPIL